MTISPATIAMIMQARSNPRAAFSQMVAEMAEDNPQAAVIGQYLQLLQSAEEEKAEEEEDTLSNTYPNQWIDESGSDVMSLREELDLLRAQADEQTELVRALTKRNRELAAALGACPLCWGEDPQCTACAGSGIPGAKRIDRKCFSYYVVPALKRVKSSPPANKSERRGDGPSAPPAN